VEGRERERETNMDIETVKTEKERHGKDKEQKVTCKPEVRQK
jgi:hypothetical protein